MRRPTDLAAQPSPGYGPTPLDRSLEDADTLEESAGDEKAAAFAVRKTPAGFTNHLKQPTGHARN